MVQYLPMKKKRLEVTKSRDTKDRTPLAVACLADAPILLSGLLQRM